MYCYGSTITCTRFPIFLRKANYKSSQGHTAPQSQSRRGMKFWEHPGCNLYFMKLSHMSFTTYIAFVKIRGWENDIVLNWVIKKIIPECLRLGNTFFTHMSVFGTLSKEYGAIPIHYDEREISCVFHLWKVISGGSTTFYGGTSPCDPGPRFHQVPFRHGTL